MAGTHQRGRPIASHKSTLCTPSPHGTPALNLLPGNGECGKQSTLSEESKSEERKGAFAAGTVRMVGCWPSRDVRGAFSSEHFWIDGQRLRAATKAPQRAKGRAVPDGCRTVGIGS